MERRLLTLSLSVICCLFSFSVMADEIYLSGSEKAMLALSLKGMQASFDDQILPLMQTLQLNFQKNLKAEVTEPVKISVKSYSDFLNFQKNDVTFTQKKLKQLSIDQLQNKLNEPQYISSTASVQNKIDHYLEKKAELRYGFLIKTLQVLKAAPSLMNKNQSFADSVFLQLNTTVDDYTKAFLNNNASDEVVLLSKLLKSYFKNLPSEQKAEIFYRLIQLPLDSSPTDIFLTMLQHSGPQMQKLVQIMGRSTSIPLEFQSIFQKLESQVQPVPWWEVKNAIEAEISLDQFTYFEKKPIGVGTIAQTHRAQMIDSTGQKHSYAVGFRKPGIAELLEMDHQVLLQVCAEVDADPEVQKMKLPSLKDRVEDIHASVLEELIMADKVKNQKTAEGFYETVKTIQFSGQKNELRIHVPEVQLLGKNKALMLQELIFGKKPESETKNYKELYPELYRVVAEEVAALWIEQAFFKSGFFHADLHQGNMIMQVLDDHIQVNLLDFGMVGQLTQSHRENILLLTLGLKLEKPEVVANAFIGLARVDVSETQKSLFVKLVEQRMKQLKNGKNSESNMQAWTTWALDHGIDLHYEFIKLNRGLMAISSLLEASGSKLDIESLGNQVVFGNKSTILSVVSKSKQIKYSDLVRVGFQLLTNKKDAGVIQCKALFTN